MAFKQIIQRRLYATSTFQKFCYNLSGFNKYGLMRDDVLMEDKDVLEALRRLPQHLRDERNYRILKAVQLHITKSVLPKSEWTQLEDDCQYLQPYLKEVRKEKEEEEAWSKNF